MTVRRIKESDFDKLILLYEHLHEDDSIVSRDVLEKIWQDILHSESFVYFVIELDELIVSSCNLTIIPNLTRGGKSIGLIENVVTHRDYRNKGLGKNIIDAAVSFAENNNCYKVMLLSGTKRKDAHQFYEKLGFSSEEKIGFVKKLS